MKTLDLNLPYKGDRDYLHGTDMYAKTLEVLNAVRPDALTGGCRLVIHRTARHQCRLLYTGVDETAPRPEKLVAEFILSAGTGNTTAWLVETTQAIRDRRPYVESRIFDYCRLTDRSIRLNDQTGFSAIEELVAMNKLLHNTHYPPENAQWYFTRLDLTRLLVDTDTGNLVVSLQKNFNQRLTRSAISAHGEMIGHIFFSMVTM